MTVITDRPKLTAELLRPQARNKWLEIFQYLCPGMFDDAIRNLGAHVTCPFHGGQADFRFTKRSTKKGGCTPETGVAMCTCGVYPDGFAVVHKARGGRFYDTLKEIDAYLNGTEIKAPAPLKPFVPAVRPLTDAEQAAKDAEILAKVKALASNGQPFNMKTTPYYVERGIDPRILEHLTDVRVVSSLGYFHLVRKEGSKETKVEKLGSFPAILAMMRDSDGNLVAVHRTWLTKDRKAKAPVPKAKKLSETPNAAGAAIRLFDAEGTDALGLCEGIETALGVRQLATGGYWPDLGPIPIWATYSERNIRNFKVPESLLPTLKKIIVFADNDERGTGLDAALEFKERMATEYPHLIVEIRMPELTGWDWLNVLENL